MYKAFEGPNGWYVAWEREDGFHRQPATGCNMAEREAHLAACERNRAEGLIPRITDIRDWDVDHPAIHWSEWLPRQAQEYYATMHPVLVPACCWHEGKWVANAFCGHRTRCPDREAKGVVYTTI